MKINKKKFKKTENHNAFKTEMIKLDNNIRICEYQSTDGSPFMRVIDIHHTNTPVNYSYRDHSSPENTAPFTTLLITKDGTNIRVYLPYGTRLS